MLTFEEFIKESLILEMPHIMLGDKVVDLELEVHSKMKPKDFIQYISDWINRQSHSKQDPRILDAGERRLDKRVREESSRATLPEKFHCHALWRHCMEIN